MKQRLRFPFQSVTPLSPLVFQRRAPQVNCSGVGQIYNDYLEYVSNFSSPLPNARSGRLQEVFVGYEAPGFVCVDRAAEAETFADASWRPWATHDELTSGTELPMKQFGV